MNYLIKYVYTNKACRDVIDDNTDDLDLDLFRKFKNTLVFISTFS